MTRSYAGVALALPLLVVLAHCAANASHLTSERSPDGIRLVDASGGATPSGGTKYGPAPGKGDTETREGVGASPDASLGLDLARHVAELEHAENPYNFAVLQSQVPPPKPRPALQPATRRLRYHHARAFFARADAWSFESLDRPVDGVGAIAKDGTLMPSVVLPGVDVPREGIKLILDTIEDGRGRPVVDCYSDRPFHAIVFYDSEERPLSQLFIDFSCNVAVEEDAGVPGKESSSEFRLSEAAGRRLRELCEEFHLGLCFFGDPERGPAIIREWSRRHVDPEAYRWRRMPVPIRIPLNKKLIELTNGERRELCVWNWMYISRWLMPPSMRGMSPRHDGGSSPEVTWGFRTLNWPECVKHFPRCDVPLGQVVPCIEALQRVTPFIEDQVPACQTMAKCIWGFEIRRGGADGKSTGVNWP